MVRSLLVGTLFAMSLTSGTIKKRPRVESLIEPAPVEAPDASLLNILDLAALAAVVAILLRIAPADRDKTRDSREMREENIEEVGDRK